MSTAGFLPGMSNIKWAASLMQVDLHLFEIQGIQKCNLLREVIG